MRYCRWYLLIGLGLGIAATGLLVFLAWRDIFDILVTEEKSLQPGTAFYKEWRRPTVRPTWEVFMYNWTNAEDTSTEDGPTEVVHFQEVGPYTYDEHTEIVDVKFHATNGTLSFRKRTFFRKTFIGASATADDITSVNYIALLASHLTRNLDYSAQRELSYLLYNFQQNVTVSRPVDQLLFTGFREPILEHLRKIICPDGGSRVPCQDERLAYFRTFNMSRKPTGVYSLDIGVNDRSKYGTVQSWGLGVDRVNSCHGFAGRTGELFPSRIDPTETITIVLPELCRRLTLEFDQEVMVGDIPAYRYVARFINPLQNAIKEDCPETTMRKGRYGMLNSNECYGLPMYETDTYEDDMERNLHSQHSGNHHLTYFVLEPITGTVLESYISLKYHTRLRPNAHIALFQEVPELTVPLFRASRIYRLSEGKLIKLKHMLHLVDVGHQAALAACIFGAVLVVLTALYAFWNARKPNKSPARNPTDQYQIVGMQLTNDERENRPLK